MTVQKWGTNSSSKLNEHLRLKTVSKLWSNLCLFRFLKLIRVSERSFRLTGFVERLLIFNMAVLKRGSDLEWAITNGRSFRFIRYYIRKEIILDLSNSRPISSYFLSRDVSLIAPLISKQAYYWRFSFILQYDSL